LQLEKGAGGDGWCKKCAPFGPGFHFSLMRFLHIIALATIVVRAMSDTKADVATKIINDILAACDEKSIYFPCEWNNLEDGYVYRIFKSSFQNSPLPLKTIWDELLRQAENNCGLVDCLMAYSTIEIHEVVDEEYALKLIHRITQSWRLLLYIILNFHI
jgi:hypothetical protein